MWVDNNEEYKYQYNANIRKLFNSCFQQLVFITMLIQFTFMGHTFHVVDVGYPEHEPRTGFIKSGGHNKKIYCDDVNCKKKKDCIKERCTRPRWASNPPQFSIHPKTIRKDTAIVTAGGYVVINFISDNPVQWFLHYHIEVHQLEGMALIVNEASNEQRKLQPPTEMNKCGDFQLSVQKYLKYELLTAKRKGQHSQQLYLSTKIMIREQSKTMHGPKAVLLYLYKNT